MERLTERYKNYVRVTGLRSVYCIEEPDEMLSMGKAISRLAAYEDTGLTPEDIIKALKTLDLLTEATNGISLNRIREFAQAEQDGRLLVLPCKIGDTLFDTTMGDIKELTVKSIPMMLYPHGLHIGLNATNYRGAFLLIEMWQIGKTVFLTREEAEAALKGGAE